MKVVLTEKDRARFVASVQESESGCWLWTGRVRSGGRGYFVWKSKHHLRASRVAWMLARTESCEGLCVCHSCDNPLCVNPDHLFLGTQADNMRDMYEKGRNFDGTANLFKHRYDHTGKKQSEATRAKRSEALKRAYAEGRGPSKPGRQASAETRTKLSAASKRTWDERRNRG